MAVITSYSIHYTKLYEALFPAAIEDYVAQDAPVRAYDAIVDAFDLKQLGMELNENKIGNSTYDPKAMLKLLIYSYSYGIVITSYSIHYTKLYERTYRLAL